MTSQDDEKKKYCTLGFTINAALQEHGSNKADADQTFRHTSILDSLVFDFANRAHATGFMCGYAQLAVLLTRATARPFVIC
jgi:hypothetical protein